MQFTKWADKVPYLRLLKSSMPQNAGQGDATRKVKLVQQSLLIGEIAIALMLRLLLANDIRPTG